VAEFENHIQESVIFQKENSVYVATLGGSLFSEVTEVYRVDLLSGMKILFFSTEGHVRRFIVSADEKFISISVFTQSPTSGSITRLELFDVSTKEKTVLKSVQAPLAPFAFDMENRTLLYNIYENGENRIRKIDLTSKADVIISDERNGVIAMIDPATRNILMQSSGEMYFIDWDGNIIGEPFTGFTPWHISPDGKKIIGRQGKFVSVGGKLIYYLEVISYTIATKEIEVLISTENQFFFLTSLSTDQNLALCSAGDLYILNTINLEKKQLMSTYKEEYGIGFFDENRQVLFLLGEYYPKILYGIKL